MKQHITVGQLNELSKEAKEKLREWWKPERLDRVKDDGIEGEYYLTDYSTEFDGWIVEDEETRHAGWKKGMLPLLSIGQMIEFLDSEDMRWHSYVVDTNTGGLSYDDELCDALWEEVRRILNYRYN